MRGFTIAILGVGLTVAVASPARAEAPTSALRNVLLNFESGLTWSAMTSGWRGQRNRWRQRVLNAPTVNRLAYALKYLESNIASKAVSSNWGSIHKSWHIALGRTYEAAGFARKLLQFERYIKTRYQSRTFTKKRKRWQAAVRVAGGGAGRSPARRPSSTPALRRPVSPSYSPPSSGPSPTSRPASTGNGGYVGYIPANARILNRKTFILSRTSYPGGRKYIKSWWLAFSRRATCKGGLEYAFREKTTLTSTSGNTSSNQVMHSGCVVFRGGQMYFIATQGCTHSPSAARNCYLRATLSAALGIGNGCRSGGSCKLGPLRKPVLMVRTPYKATARTLSIVVGGRWKTLYYWKSF